MIEWLREIMDYPFELDRKDSSISPKTDACSIGKEGKGISESNVCVSLAFLPSLVLCSLGVKSFSRVFF
jgi:hypothetical protein